MHPLRVEIERLQKSTDGDEKLMGDALNFYAEGVGDEDLEKVMLGTATAFMEILVAFLRKTPMGYVVK